jgi:hypothetical protein
MLIISFLVVARCMLRVIMGNFFYNLNNLKGDDLKPFCWLAVLNYAKVLISYKENKNASFHCYKHINVKCCRVSFTFFKADLFTTYIAIQCCEVALLFHISASLNHSKKFLY